MSRKFIVAAAVMSIGTAFGSPALNGYSFTQDPNTGVANVSFILTEDAVLTMDVKTNGVSIGWRNYRNGITGVAVGKVNKAGAYSVRWRPMDTWNTDKRRISGGHEGVTIEFKAWSVNNTPDFMDVDLSSQSNVTYYVSDEELPYCVTDNVYKTSHMLFRRIHAANKVWRMGSPAGETGRPKADGRERAHLVSLSADYYMAVFETTQGQWKNMGAGAIGTCSATNDICPLAGRTLAAIRGYSSDLYWPRDGRNVGSASAAAKFRQKTGIKVDLPTEAQWEYACRAGVSEAYQNGSNTITADALSEFAVWKGNAPTVVSDDLTKTSLVFSAVGTKRPNGFGLYDMIGNVAEICVDQGQSLYDDGYAIDPCGTNRGYTTAWVSGSLVWRGSYYSQPIYNWNDLVGVNYYFHRSAYRYVMNEDIRQSASGNYGFRFVSPVGDWPPMVFAADTAVQDSGSRTVNITYDLAADAIVTLAAYTNGVKVSDEAFRCISGDVNRLVPAGEGKRISWYPDASWPGLEIGNGEMSFSIEKWDSADPPDYMALDLTHSTMTNVFWYRSAEAMPEPITNDIWKTDYLVMRRIPAKDVVWWMGVQTNSTGVSVENVGYDPGWARRHRVKFSQDFYMSVFELTRRQTRVFGDASSGTDVAENWTLPFAGSFVKLRSRNSPNGTWPLTGHAVNSTANIMKFRDRFALQFDLPTEAQWEYACRAGSARAFDGSQTTASNGNHQDNLKDYGWFTENSGGVAHPVGTKLPNAWGLYDMHGNLAEYCLDAVSDKMGLTDGQLGSETPVTDPFGAYSGVASDTQRMFRGGAYSSDFFRCRSGNRNNESANHPDSAWPSLGYRLVCPLPGATFAEPVIPVE